PAGEDNLVVRAARAMMDRYGIQSGLRIGLVKRIPVGAGLGGGSGNAAAVLTGVCRMFRLKPSREDLSALALSIGSDVPFFLNGPTAWVSGIGEEVTPGNLSGGGWMVLVNPGFELSTSWAYGEYDRTRPVFGPERGRGLEKIGLTLDPEHLNIPNRRVKAFPLLRRSFSLQNDLEVIAIRRHPVIAAIKKSLCSLGAREALMSGSGPTVFGLFADSVSARRAAVRLRQSGGMKQTDGKRNWTIRVARIMTRPPW
ncbi:MAG TPA: 4-(cytidine 5'-diphospho)-2-C-methyl-D-erythritol kinase, partial [Nitrospiria bacterium]